MFFENIDTWSSVEKHDVSRPAVNNLLLLYLSDKQQIVVKY